MAVKTIEDVRPTGISSKYVPAPYDIGRAQLDLEGYPEITLAINAKLRRQQGKDAHISQNGNWTAEDFVYDPKKGIYLSKVSIISENPKLATDAHRANKDFYLTEEQVQRTLSNAVKIPSNQKPIPTKRFGSERITVYAFGTTNGKDTRQDAKDAQEYGLFLHESGIKAMPFVLAGVGDKPYAVKSWFRSLAYESGLGGNYWCLSYAAVRGVRNGVVAEGDARTNLYGLAQIRSALESVGFTGQVSGLVERALSKN
ncbi:MAG: hypothetical protein NTX24_01415 [Candidatus Pacearchaeota archaeon]|nr:hypothetical protein [Candidatus Pacearchaeota archaeon]